MKDLHIFDQIDIIFLIKKNIILFSQFFLIVDVHSYMVLVYQNKCSSIVFISLCFNRYFGYSFFINKFIEL